MRNNQKSFFMVQGISKWNKSAKFRHPTFEAAKAEAERIAAIRPGEVYFIMKSVGAVKVAPPAQPEQAPIETAPAAEVTI